MKYLFILGRNPELSIEEINSYFKKIQNKIISSDQHKNSVLIETDKKIEKGIINVLGGTIAIGEVLCAVDVRDMEKQNPYSGTSNKLNYVIWNFSEDNAYNKTSEYLKKRFKQEQLKATEKNLNGSLELQDETRVRIVHGLVDEEYFVFNNNFGKIIEKCDYEEIEQRDMAKPVRRHALSISPRLAKIMINLSEVKKEEKLLDPFCGIGTILIEALMQNIKVIGVDKDKNAIQDALKNLVWSKQPKENYRLLCGDSRSMEIKGAMVIATEPNFGQVLKEMPPKEKALSMIKDYESLMIGVLKNLKNSVAGRIVFTAPLIKTQNKRISCNIQRILQETKLKLVNGFPIQEYRKLQIVGREIIVLEK